MNKYNDNQGKKILAITLMVALVGGVWYVSDQQKLAASEEQVVTEEDGGQVALGQENVETIEEADGLESYEGDVVMEEDDGIPSYQDGVLTVEGSEENVSENASEEINVVNELQEVTITVNDAEKMYGEEDPEFTCTIDGATKEELGNVVYSREEGEEVGTYTIHASCKNDQYAITVKEGTLTIKQSDQNQFEVLTEDKTYNGKEQTALIVNTTHEDDTVSYTMDGKESSEAPTFKNAGTYNVTVTVKNKNYSDLSKDVTVTVNPKKATLISNSAEKVYDGTALTCEDVEAEGFVAGDTVSLTYDFTGSQLDAGTSENTFTYTGDASNYDISVQYGTLSVTPITQVITIKAGSANKVYDGTPLSYNGYSYTNGILVNGDVLKASVEGSITNVSDGTVLIGPSGKSCGEVENKVVSYTITRDGKDVSGNYTVELAAGKLDLYKKQVSLIVDNAYKVVGQQDPTFTYSVDGILSGDSIGTVTFQRDEGEDISYEDQDMDGYFIEADCKDVNPNYNVAEILSGKLYIIPSEGDAFVTVSVKTSTYNGTSDYLSVKTSEGSKVTYSIDNGKTWTESSPKLEAGTYTVMVKATNDNGSYTFEKEISIAQRAITITAGSGYKLYDGTALKETSAYLTSGSLAGNDKISSVSVSGKQTNVGSSANTIQSVVILDENGNDVTKNYNITKVDGTLTVAWTGTLPTNQNENTTTNTSQDKSEDKEETDKVDVKEVSIGSTNSGKDLTEQADNVTPEANIDLEEEKNYTLPIIAVCAAAAAGLWFFIAGKRRKDEEEA